MRKAIIAVAALLALGFLLGSTDRATAKPDPKKLHVERIKRGEFLVTIGGCNDCHTPLKMGPNGPEPDWSRRLSGHPEGVEMPPAPKLGDPRWMWTGSATMTAFAGPWGVSYARNLTPDELTGTGIWTEEMFIQTLRTGKHWGVSRPILPPMPWQNLKDLPEEDLKSIWAYLQSLPPIKNQVPDPILAPPPPAAVAAK